MKKFLLLILVFPLFSLAQTINSIEHYPSINLESGWNMVGYTCLDPMNVEDALLSLGDTVLIVKDNNGNVYLPEFNFNGIEQFEFGFGYQLKLSQAVFNFSFCPFLVPLVEGCTDATAFNYDSNANTEGDCIPVVFGCIDATAFNFDSIANTDDNSCEPILEGCIDSSAFNYNDLANTDNESCIYLGCTDHTALNYNSSSIIDNGECEYIDYFSIPDSGFLAYLEDNYPDVIQNGLLDIQATSSIIQLNIYEEDWTHPLYNINSLDGIQYFLNLEHIYTGTSTLTNFIFSDLNITDIFLDETNLIDVQITNSSIQNLALGFACGDIPLLTNLNLSESSIIELSIGGSNCQLEIDFINPELSDIILPINLNQIFLTGSGLQNNILQQIYNLDSLEILGLSGLSVTPEIIEGNPDLSGLNNLTNLNYLDISDIDGLTSLPELSGLTNLSSLTINNNDGLTSLPELSGLTNLSSLTINNNDGLTSLPELSGLTNLSYLGIYNNYYLECVGGYPEQLTIQGNWPTICPPSCPYDIFIEYSSNAILYDEDQCLTLIVNGCTDIFAANYNEDANIDDGSCEYILGCTEQEADNYNNEATLNDDSCIFYGCTDEASYNYDTSANIDDGSCLIGGCVNYTAENYNEIAMIDDGSCIIFGCTIELFPNYNPEANEGDGTCDMNSEDVFGCTDSIGNNYNELATLDNGSCDVNLSIAVGDLAEGGIVFYVDETGEHGLVAALEDLTEGATDPYGWGFGYEWGCYGTSVSGADGQAIGTGYQNTMDIVNQGCVTDNGGITAAQAALDAEINGYSDWYLPSFDELIEMYNTIGNGSPDGDIGGFGNNSSHWSSSELDSIFAWAVNFGNGTSSFYDKNYTRRVRVIRAF